MPGMYIYIYIHTRLKGWNTIHHRFGPLTQTNSACDRFFFFLPCSTCLPTCITYRINALGMRFALFNHQEMTPVHPGLPKTRQSYKYVYIYHIIIV